MSQKTVKIHFPLPFYIPIESDSTYMLDLHKLATHKFKFITKEGDSAENGVKSNQKSTIIIAEITSDSLIENSTIQDIVLHSVVNAITTINNFLDALRLDANWNFIPNFSVTDLPTIIEFEIDGETFSYITQPTRILRLLDLDKEHANRAAGRALSRISMWYENPQLEVIDKFLSKGIHHLYTEEFTFAIVELQTSFETYIRLCQRIILTKNGKTESEIETALDFPFRNTIEHHLGSALGADLKFKANPKIKAWYDTLYTLRNKIVHKGESYISGDAAYAAYDALQEVVNYITGLMVDNGYMHEDGKITIADFNKNTPSDVDRNKIHEALIKQGIIKEIED